MTSLAQSRTFNVEASLNAWMQAALEAYDLPLWLGTTPAIVYDAPQTNAVMPCFSLIHIPVDARQTFQGRRAGSGSGNAASGILEVSCWVSRSKSRSWVAQLRTMRDMVMTAAVGTSAVIVYDYAGLPANTAAPAIATNPIIATELAGDDGAWSDDAQATAYKIDIGDSALTPTLPENNPDIQRARILIDYRYIFRVD